MKKTIVSFPIITAPFKQHAELKESILEKINQQTVVDRLVSDDGAHDITRCDWRQSRFDYEREWLKVFRPHVIDHLANWVKQVGYTSFQINEIWFQQYETNSHHSWHIHGNNFTNVYYLELPEGGAKTQWIDPLDQTTVHEFDVKEGDIITFPSFLIHCAPKNMSPLRKTIISWNLDIGLTNNYY